MSKQDSMPAWRSNCDEPRHAWSNSLHLLDPDFWCDLGGRPIQPSSHCNPEGKGSHLRRRYRRVSDVRIGEATTDDGLGFCDPRQEFPEGLPIRTPPVVDRFYREGYQVVVTQGGAQYVIAHWYNQNGALRPFIEVH